MACGEYGPGRMAEPAEILAGIEAYFAGGALPLAGGSAARPLAGRMVLITAGPTHEPIDPVRYIANRSSGRQGYALAEAAVALGAETVIVSGPVSLPIPPGAQMIPVETAVQMLAEVERELPADIAIFAAAVADWRVAQESQEKIKKGKSGAPDLKLAENPDILSTVAHLKAKRPALVVGFAAETQDLITNAKAKLARKGCDVIVANDVSNGKGVMGGEENEVHLVSPKGVESWPRMHKREVAAKLMADFAKRI
jgi:phosphopantothenoylcysteine decarboxylase/phosphopantothenate--cysteine ligase